MDLVKKRAYRLAVIILVISSFTPVSLISISADAAMVDSRMILPDGTTSSDREIDEKKVRRALENKIVIEKLKSYGLTKDEVLVKMERMSDEQVHQMAALSDRIPAGGNHAVGLLIGALVVVILVLLILFLVKRV